MDLLRLDIADILEGYKKRHFKPSEIVSAYLKAIDSNKELNAFLQTRPEHSLQLAQALDDRVSEAGKLPLFGIPIAVKDNFLVKGWQATAASKILEQFVSPYTASCVKRLESAGAIVIGKTNLDEFAMGSSNENSAFGIVKNPWDLSRVPGGSSGGSAAAVSAGLAPLALGTDTGGSIRQPASFCGVVGLKPTYGRVSRYGIIAFASSLDQVGPFAHTTWDCARTLEAMAGNFGRDATVSSSVVHHYTDELKNYSVKNLKVGVDKRWLEGVDDEVKQSFNENLKMLKEAGMTLVDIELPHAKYAVSTYYLVATSEASSNLARYDGVHYGHRSSQTHTSGEDVYLKSRGEGFGKEVKLRVMLGTYALSAGYYDAYYNKANKVRRLIQQDFERAFEKCDTIACPTAPTTAFKHGEKSADPVKMYLSDVYTIPANLAGIPGISIPGGLDSSGLPIGFQLLGKHFDEKTLFQIGDALEKVRGGFEVPKRANS